MQSMNNTPLTPNNLDINDVLAIERAIGRCLAQRSHGEVDYATVNRVEAVASIADAEDNARVYAHVSANVEDTVLPFTLRRMDDGTWIALGKDHPMHVMYKRMTDQFFLV